MASCGENNDGNSSAVTEQPATTTGSDAVATGGVGLTALPIGDGHISTQPRIDNVYSCQTEFNENAGGAQADGPWISEKNGT
jgi:hypothetical protein